MRAILAAIFHRLDAAGIGFVDCAINSLRGVRSRRKLVCALKFRRREMGSGLGDGLRRRQPIAREIGCADSRLDGGG